MCNHSEFYLYTTQSGGKKCLVCDHIKVEVSSPYTDIVVEIEVRPV